MPNDDFERFRALHEMDGRAPLNKVERAEYDRVKERFAEAICAGQQLAVKPGQTARATFRVALLFRLTLTIDGVAQQTATFDVSGGGFARLDSRCSSRRRRRSPAGLASSRFAATTARSSPSST
jgi:hypothetical protein